MDPGPKPFSDEETRIFYTIRDDMDEVFRLANALGKVGIWEELSRRLEAYNHHRSPEELQEKFGHYRPKRPTKKRKCAVPANEQEQAQCSSAPHQDRQKQARDQLARSQEMEAERKRLIEKIDLSSFFSETTSWEEAISSLRSLQSDLSGGKL